MEEEVLKKLYQEYLSHVLYIKNNEEYDNKDFKKYFSYDKKYKVKKTDDGYYAIINTITLEITYKTKKEIHEIEDLPGVFWIWKNDYVKLIDIYGRKIDYLDGPRDKYELLFHQSIIKETLKGKKHYFFNDVLDSYEPLKYDIELTKIEYDSKPHISLKKETIILFQTEDFILFYKTLKDGTNKVYIYRKAISTYEELEYDYENGHSVNMNFDHNIIKLNNTYYYITPFASINITHLLKDNNYGWKTSIIELTDNLLTFEEFKRKIIKDKNFMDSIKKIKTEKYKDYLEETERIKKQKEILEKQSRKKELLESMYDLMKKFKKIDGEMIDTRRLEVEEDILLIDVDDHKEINPIFKDYLSLIDLQYISFKNVKVSGIDFSYSNAVINPQEVYNKDMSNGDYSGLDFNIANFNKVNIKGSKFIDCIMDFTGLTNAISDEETILPKSKKL